MRIRTTNIACVDFVVCNLHT